MYEAIYTTLRAYFSYLPDDETIDQLKDSQTLSNLEKQVSQWPLVHRFPLEKNQLMHYLDYLPYHLGQQIEAQLIRGSQRFFSTFMCSYELTDIKTALQTQRG